MSPSPFHRKPPFFSREIDFLLGLDYVTLGSIRQYDNFSQEICEHDSRGIWKRTTTLVPSLKKAQIVCEAVGIRPNRTKVRVEAEVKILKDGITNLNIIHHYGHCGYGVLSSPGSAVHVSQLVKKVLTGND